MKITQLYIYPVKSLRGISTAEAQLRKNGFQYDRCFMLVKHEEYKGMPHRNMHLAHFPEMMLFTTSIIPPKTDSDRGMLSITFNPAHDQAAKRSIDVPLQPDVTLLSPIDIDMWQSGTQAYKMEENYSSWFSGCFGYDVSFVYLGPKWRSVLMSTDTNGQRPQPQSWISSITSRLPGSSLLSSAPVKEQERITFADCAPLLVTTEESLADVSSRLSGFDVEMVKFRPNLVVSGAPSAWAEDYWNEIAIGGDNENSVRVTLPHNCARCASLNIDYSTGKPGTGEGGKVLKSLQKDRRVDPGMKYSPVFGRYGLVSQGAGTVIRVGDEVVLVGQNEKRTVFDWPGLSTAPA